MKYNVIPTPLFKRQAKKLFKRYVSLISELKDMDKALQLKPTLGTPLGNNTYKLRVAIKSKGKGKSGGARIISYVVTPAFEVYLLCIYDKSDISTIDDRTLKLLVAQFLSGRKV